MFSGQNMILKSVLFSPEVGINVFVMLKHFVAEYPSFAETYAAWLKTTLFTATIGDTYILFCDNCPLMDITL